MQKNEIINLVKIAIFSALYVAVSLLISPLAFGPFQFRLSEMFNHLIVFNKRYIWAVTIGCVIVNMFSPLGVIDVLVGAVSQPLIGLLIYYSTKVTHNLCIKLLISSLILSIIGMIPVALELTIVQHLPFWITYFSTSVGELISCILGAIIIYGASKRIDFSK